MSGTPTRTVQRHFAIRHAYEEHGVEAYYRENGARYRNPHEDRIETVVRRAAMQWDLQPTARILDLACGSGEVTLALRRLNFTHVEGVDPFTSDAFEARTGTPVCGRWTFEQIAAGSFAEELSEYDTVVCSFAAHLIQPSFLPCVMLQLSVYVQQLIILTPHKRPQFLRSGDGC